MLDNLCKSRTQLSKWKRVKTLRIYNPCGSGMENAYEVLPGEGVHPSLSADRSVDHSDQRAGHLDDRSAPHKRGGAERRQVTDIATSERDDRVIPATPVGEH